MKKKKKKRRKTLKVEDIKMHAQRSMGQNSQDEEDIREIQSVIRWARIRRRA
jgi:hypothetical protein